MTNTSAAAVLAAFALAGWGTIRAEVIDSAPRGFTVQNRVRISAPPQRVYKALTDIGRWWHSDHTFSGDAANLSLDAKAMGCFCEKLPGGGDLRHLEVIYAEPGKMLRLSGGLGPLQGVGVAGALTISLSAREKGTELELVYGVGGYHPKGLDSWAAAVDGVLRQQIERLKKYVETGSAD